MCGRIIMKHLNLLATIALCLCLVTGCKKDIPDAGELSSNAPRDSQIAGNPAARLSLSPEKIRKLRASLPAGYKKRLQQGRNQLLLKYPEYRTLARKALESGSESCDANTALNRWLNDQLADWDGDATFFAIFTGMLDFPAYDALFFANSSANQYFGIRGEYSQRVQKTFKDLKRFWDIQSDDIVLAGMHGSMLQNRDRVILMDEIMFGDSKEVAEYYADLIQTLLKETPQYRNGNHPIFTFNAYAQQEFNFPPFGKIPAKIVMGDGILEGFSAIGFKDIAPQAILAHEFGHQVQFQLGVFGDEVSPEATRRTELMADAYSAYYLSHSRGASMQWKRVQQFLQVFFNIGDCSFNDTSHHGTPAERMAAARWAYNLANDAQKQGHIMSSREFARRFEAYLPALASR